MRLLHFVPAKMGEKEEEEGNFRQDIVIILWSTCARQHSMFFVLSLTQLLVSIETASYFKHQVCSRTPCTTIFKIISCMQYEAVDPSPNAVHTFLMVIHVPL